MASVKQVVMQRDFSLMELRQDFLDADGDEMRARSLKGAMNMRSMTTRVAQARPGSFFVRHIPDAVSFTEVRPEDGSILAVVVRASALEVIDDTGEAVARFTDVPWTTGLAVWVREARDRVFIGHPGGLLILAWADGAWTLNPWTFLAAEGGEIAQPYWSFQRNISILPSARTGRITVKASKPIFSGKYVGTRIRYGYREIKVAQYLSPTEVTGDVVGQLPPSFDVTVESGADFRVGEIVVGQDTDWQGFVISKPSTNVLRAVTTHFFAGPDVGERLSGTAGSSKVTAKTEIAPQPSTIWDEALFSRARGFPRSASVIGGRMVFVDFPQVPDLIVMSSARDLQDFRVGSDDDDAIVRQEGDGAPRFLHAINAGDLLLLSDRGCYYVPVRENAALTPTTFNAILFDKRGASPIPPVNVDDGVVFVEANGEGIAAALLDGNVYLKWSVQPLTLFHHHLIKAPVGLCGPAIGSKEAEKYLFIVNGDGTLAAMSWSMKLGEEAVGFSPWSTTGEYRHVAPLFGGYWALVDRAQGKFVEQFDSEAWLDCAARRGASFGAAILTANGVTVTADGDEIEIDTPGAAHLPNTKVSVVSGPSYVGDFTLGPTGALNLPSISAETAQIGLPFTARMDLWPVELVESPRIGMLTARVIRLSVSVQDTTAFQIACNRSLRTLGGYAAGDDLSKPPPLHTGVFRAPVIGRRDHPELSVIKHIPGPFRVLAVGQEVQG